MSTNNKKTRDMLLDEFCELDTVDELHQVALFETWGQLIADEIERAQLERECAGLDSAPGICIDDHVEDGTYQVTMFAAWGQMIADDMEWLESYIGLWNTKHAEELDAMGDAEVSMEAFPVGGVEASLKHMEDMFLAWCGEEPTKVAISRKRFEDGGNLGYRIYEDSAFLELPLVEQANLKKTMGRFCIVVPDGFFEWLDTEKYRINIEPHAELFIHQRGDRYLIDANNGEGHVLQRIGESMRTLTVADYWVSDVNDVKLSRMIDEFSKDIARAIAAIPVTASAKNGPGRPKKADEPQPNTPEYIEKERNKVLSRYRKVLEDRYEDYAGYNAERILKKVKKIKADNPVVVNSLERTGSLVPMRNGVYDLRTCRFRSALPSDYITVWAPTTYDKRVRNANVDKFIDQFTCGREDLKTFLAQVLGVGLDLNMITRTLCELWGQSTTNGKSTLVKALVNALGKQEQNGLAQVLSNKAIGMPANASDDSCPTPSLGMIRYARLLFASEPDKGMKVNWAVVKQLTSGDTLVCRQLYERPKVIPARATLIIDTNHALRVTDQSVFERGTIQVLPCDYKVTAENKDNDIDAKLSTESAKSALMNFMLEGYKSYVSNGNQFAMPPCAKAALDKNKKQSDRIGTFMEENYITKDQPMTKKVAMRPMWDEYVTWCQDNGYTHPEVYTSFCNYFEANSRTYTMGELHNQKALCGVMKCSTTEEIKPTITGNNLDWYIGEYLVEDTQSDGQQVDMDGQVEAVETVKLETIHVDYKRKVTEAGGQALEFWQFYGELMGRRWNITMGTPGDTSTITVTGWHVASKSELRKKQEAKVEARAIAIHHDVRMALQGMDVGVAASLQLIMRHPPVLC